MASISNVHPIAATLASIQLHEGKIDNHVVTLAKLIIKYQSMTFRAVCGKGDEEVAYLFNFVNMFDERKLACGIKVDGRYKAAMYKALMADLGITDWPNFQHNWLKGWRVGMAAENNLGLEIRGSDIVLPIAVAMPTLFDAAGGLSASGKKEVKRRIGVARQSGKNLTEAAAEKALRATKVVCAGGKHPEIDGYMPSVTSATLIAEKLLTEAGKVKAKGNRNGSAAKAAVFAKSLDVVLAALTGVLDPNGDSDFAPADEVLGKMVTLADTLAAFLASDDSKSDVEQLDLAIENASK